MIFTWPFLADVVADGFLLINFDNVLRALSVASRVLVYTKKKVSKRSLMTDL